MTNENENRLHPEGRFLGTIKAGGYAETKNTGTPKVWICVQTDHGEVYWDGWLTEKAVDRTEKTLQELGWVSDGTWNVETLAGTQVRVLVQHEEQTGYETRAKVRYIDPPDARPAGARAFRAPRVAGEASQETRPAKHRTVDAGTAMGQGAASVSAPASGAARALPGFDDDSLPF